MLVLESSLSLSAAAAAELGVRRQMSFTWVIPMGGCKRCGGEVVQKSRGRLVLVGVLMLAALGLGTLWWPLWVPATVSGLTGAYLLAWASIGRGRWCRGCKRFDGV